jgi:hypothetical protein
MGDDRRTNGFLFVILLALLATPIIELMVRGRSVDPTAAAFEYGPAGPDILPPQRQATDTGPYSNAAGP